MISESIYDDLLDSLEKDFTEIMLILKCLGNENRLQILMYLVKTPKSYGNIVKNIELKKTAVSNHLSQLLDVNMIEKEEHGVYKISADGLSFIKAIERAYQDLPSKQVKKFETLQQRSISNSFLDRFKL
ncbi:MAG: ArsR family transcriptional regulator [Candidatus Lokiarchaeota archaeon]|nr:ArsR family transcriptional regulator [Candidatus Lokiarchaeota archaeon]MBD3337526.1 ArsR family transcriptional regulator [Candidatus Lokiarchaeota archaeon]